MPNYEGTLVNRLFLILCAVALLATVAVSGASAFTRPAGVIISRCVSAGGGQATVPAGTDVRLVVGDIERTRGNAEAATKNWTFTSATLDGVAVTNTSSYWNAPIADTDFLNNGVIYPNVWDAWWIENTGVTLGVGQAMTFEFTIVAEHPAPDSFSHGAPAPGPYPQVVVGGTCTITGT